MPLGVAGYLKSRETEIFVRSLLALANVHDWEVHQVDLKAAFLQGNLDDEIYMKQPDGYVNEQYPNHGCKLKKSLYGLKQAARC